MLVFVDSDHDEKVDDGDTDLEKKRSRKHFESIFKRLYIFVTLLEIIYLGMIGKGTDGQRCLTMAGGNEHLLF
jgi:hypothetical protein